MTIANYAIVENGTVINTVVWDGVSEWSPPSGSTAHPLPAGSPVGIGWTFDGEQYSAPAQTTP